MQQTPASEEIFVLLLKKIQPSSQDQELLKNSTSRALPKIRLILTMNEKAHKKVSYNFFSNKPKRETVNIVLANKHLLKSIL